MLSHEFKTTFLLQTGLTKTRGRCRVGLRFFCGLFRGYGPKFAQLRLGLFLPHPSHSGSTMRALTFLALLSSVLACLSQRQEGNSRHFEFEGKYRWHDNILDLCDSKETISYEEKGPGKGVICPFRGRDVFLAVF